MRLYRDAFVASPQRAEPHSILTVSAYCADDEPAARALASSQALSVVRMRSGRAADLPTPREAAEHAYSEREAQQLERFWRAQLVGDPESLRQQLEDLVEQTAANEAMVMTTVHSHPARVRSYELLIQAWEGSQQTVAATDPE